MHFAATLIGTQDPHNAAMARVADLLVGSFALVLVSILIFISGAG